MGNCLASDQSAVNHHFHSSTATSTKPPIPETTSTRKQNGQVVGKEDEKESAQVEVKTNKIMPSSGKLYIPSVKIFTLTELKSATKNFKPDNLLGEGGFGKVFKGWVDEKTYAPTRPGVGIPVAVKKSNPDSSQGLEEWQAEVKFLGKFSHPNLVKLLGYCWEESQFLLVYECMQKGSLENHLFRHVAEPLSWETRLKIAIDAARGVDFLHRSEKSVIYRDFKASNILLDGDYNAKLSDFGLAKFGPINGDSHLTTRILGTPGYAAPEYVSTAHLYVKSDVYGFGVVLLEILTGERVLDTSRPTFEHNMVTWAKPALCSKIKLKKIMDSRLENNYPISGAMRAGELILKCLELEPKNRPSMEQVLNELITISEIKGKTKDRKSANGKAREERHKGSSLTHKSSGRDTRYKVNQYRQLIKRRFICKRM